MQSCKLPIELCESVVDCLSGSGHNPTLFEYAETLESNPTLNACSLVQLRTSIQAHAFLDAVRHCSHKAQLVQYLGISLVPLPSSLSSSEPWHDRREVKPTTIPPCYYDWIYKVLIQLPHLLVNLSTLALFELPTLHPRFIRLVSRFKTVKGLTLWALNNQSFSEINQVINHLPQLKSIYFCYSTWRQPVRFFPSHRLRLEQVACLPSKYVETDMLDWLGSLQCLSGLRYLQWIPQATDIASENKLHHLLQRCRHTLRYLDLQPNGAEIFGSLSLFSHLELEYLTIWIPSSPFPNDISLFSSHITQILSPSLVYLNIGSFQNLNFESLATSKSHWKDIDDALNDRKFNRLAYFIMSLSSVYPRHLNHKTLRATFKTILPKSYQRGILWVAKGSYDERHRGEHSPE
ncbi:hypothetical protein NLI96_g6853 [Meripilus lineatus]|uniref:F-box domain-containing protein n=1 Tax=Meripilus lineatus TaxID=2056292 RepID=A0AAD5YDH2_9APHY|nr:hypothetical protein NLI96_g6853 [Physisporinus lineatus]